MRRGTAHFYPQRSFIHSFIDVIVSVWYLSLTCKWHAFIQPLSPSDLNEIRNVHFNRCCAFPAYVYAMFINAMHLCGNRFQITQFGEICLYVYAFRVRLSVFQDQSDVYVYTHM